MEHPRFEVGRVKFVLLWVWGKDHGDAYREHKYEVTLAHFPDRVEIIRVGDTVQRLRTVTDKKSPEWMRITAMLSSKGLLEVEKCLIS